MSLLFIIPVAIITADRFLRFGGIWALAWGPPLVGIVAGRVHRDLQGCSAGGVGSYRLRWPRIRRDAHPRVAITAGTVSQFSAIGEQQ